MTRTEKLVKVIKKIHADNKSEIAEIPRIGPKGGRNARCIDGWTHSDNGTITRACNLAGMPTMPWWSGTGPTPATAIPLCVSDEIEQAYFKIFS